MNGGVAFLLFVVVLAVGFFLFVDQFNIQFSTGFLQKIFGNNDFIKNTVSDEPYDGGVYWKKNMLNVYIEKTDSIDIDRVDAVNKSIFSDETHVGNEYDGWSGALKELDLSYSNNKVPDGFRLVPNEDSADIIIYLVSNESETKGVGGTTQVKIRSDGEIIESKITIFQANQYTPLTVSSITRHEVGHALGLQHVSRQNDLMSETLKFANIFIKQKNIDDLFSHYESLV